MEMEIAQEINGTAPREKQENFWKKLKTFFRKLPARITGVIIGWISFITFIQYFDNPILELLGFIIVGVIFSEASVKVLNR